MTLTGGTRRGTCLAVVQLSLNPETDSNSCSDADSEQPTQSISAASSIFAHLQVQLERDNGGSIERLILPKLTHCLTICSLFAVTLPALDSVPAAQDVDAGIVEWHPSPRTLQIFRH